VTDELVAEPQERSVSFVVAPHAVKAVQEDEQKAAALAWCALSFRYFVNFWWFLDQESGTPRRLGDVLWPGQEKFIGTCDDHNFIFFLKARKLGFTTLEQAFDGWVARFRGTNERVHMFSRRDDAAVEILRNVKYGLDRLPDWMKLPYGVTRTNELHLTAGPDDTRILKAYPANEDTAVEATCTHGHVDEWARMANPRRVWQAIEPSMAGTCHIVTTGMGPGNYASEFWLATIQGDTRFHPFFVKATERPDRTEAMVLQKRKEMSETDARREYPMSWKDSLYAGVDLLFSGSHLEWCGSQGSGEQEAREGHIYLKTWDIGRHRDAAVCVVIDWSASPPEVVHYERLRGHTYPAIQQKIKDVHELYPPVRQGSKVEGKTVIEDNNAGEAVRENLDIDPREVGHHHTTGTSKPRMIKKAEVAIQNHELVWSKTAFPQLHTELDSYRLPDDALVQDSVMAFCINVDYATNPKNHKAPRARARVVQLG
jgi:hypothetical protein